MTTPEPADATVFSEVVTPDEAALRDHLDRTYSFPWNVARTRSFDNGTVVTAQWPREWEPRLLDLAQQAGAWCGLPVERIGGSIGRYDVGGLRQWHRDREPVGMPSTAQRQLSLSIMLSCPQRDFTGGDLEMTTDAPRLASPGHWSEPDHPTRINFAEYDAAAYTSATLHQVKPVTSGSRYVVVIFAGTAGRYTLG